MSTNQTQEEYVDLTMSLETWTCTPTILDFKNELVNIYCKKKLLIYDLL